MFGLAAVNASVCARRLLAAWDATGARSSATHNVSVMTLLGLMAGRVGVLLVTSRVTLAVAGTRVPSDGTDLGEDGAVPSGTNVEEPAQSSGVLHATSPNVNNKMTRPTLGCILLYYSTGRLNLHFLTFLHRICKEW